MRYDNRVYCIFTVYLAVAFLFIKVLKNNILELIWRRKAILLVDGGLILPLKDQVYQVGVFFSLLFLICCQLCLLQRLFQQSPLPSKAPLYFLSVSCLPLLCSLAFSLCWLLNSISPLVFHSFIFFLQPLFKLFSAWTLGHSALLPTFKSSPSSSSVVRSFYYLKDRQGNNH